MPASIKYVYIFKMERNPGKPALRDIISKQQEKQYMESIGHVCKGNCYPPESGDVDQLNLTTINRSADSEIDTNPQLVTVFDESK